jgi:hypothetical protein
MLNSWSTVVTENKDKSEYFNPSLPQFSQPGMPKNNNYSSSRADYEKYGWLFGR